MNDIEPKQQVQMKHPPNFRLPLFADQYENDEVHLIAVDIPGQNKEQVKLNLEDQTLVITVERRPLVKEDMAIVHSERPLGMAQKRLLLPSLDCLKINEIDATCKDGVLWISIPKMKIQSSERKVVNIPIS